MSLLSATLHHCDEICIHCLNLDVADSSHPIIQELKTNWSIVKPICKDCIKNELQPVTIKKFFKIKDCKKLKK